jgi:hypothetical protein
MHLIRSIFRPKETSADEDINSKTENVLSDFMPIPSERIPSPPRGKSI